MNAKVLAFYKNLYDMNITSFQTLVEQLFDKDTANKLVTKINKFQTPVGCVLRFFVKHMSIEQCRILNKSHTFWYTDAGNFLCDMHTHIFDKRHVMLRKINKSLPCTLPRVLRNIVEEYISRHFIEIYETLCDEDMQKLYTYYALSMWMVD